MAHTFEVGNKPIPEYFAKRRPKMKHWLEDRNVKSKVAGKTLHTSSTQTVGGSSPLFHAISYAFNSHCPLVLTPDSVWLTILSGLSHHIDTDPEGLRHNFVSHEGKRELLVFVDARNVFDIADDQWEGSIKDFSEQLQENLNPKKHDLLISNFSTTTSIDKISSEVALMGAMKHYFEYKMMLLCGLTKVTILGTVQDWEDIINRTQALSEFNLSWWTKHLLPVLEKIKDSCAGKPDVGFWEAAYLRHRKGSGGQSDVSGWINTFYPYVAGRNKMIQNPYVNWEDKSLGGGLDTDDFPFGLVKAPVKIDDHGKEYEAEFYGGLVGVSLAEDFTVKPESGISIQFLGQEEEILEKDERTEIEVLPGDKERKPLNIKMTEKIGVGIGVINPRGLKNLKKKS
jgi:Domain of unknown function (DUF4419)